MSFPITVLNTNLTSPFALTEGQKHVLEQMAKFLSQAVVPEQLATLAMTVSGSAGTGKTSLLKLLINYNNSIGSRKRKILAAALTHKARKVLDHTINRNTLIKIPTATVAHLLKKQRQAGFIGTKKFGGKGSVIGDYDVIIIDEVSMVSDKDFASIMQWAQMYGTKILFLGDSNQIPHPIQDYILRDGMVEKKDSAAFTIKNRQRLTQVMRQGENNPILEICCKICENLRSPENLYVAESKLNSLGQGVTFFREGLDFTQAISEFFVNKTPEQMIFGKVIVYTNQAVEQYNNIIRNVRFPGVTDPLVIGDILMGYEGIGFPTPWIENGQEYLVTKVQWVVDHAVSIAKSDAFTPGAYPALTEPKLAIMEGHRVMLLELNRGTDGVVYKGKTTTVFFPNLHSEQNYPIMQDLMARAELVNRYRSTTADFKNYQQLKEQILFMEAVYRWGDDIIPESEFQKRHPLLRTRVLDLMQEEILKNTKGDVVGCKRTPFVDKKNYQEIEALYPKLIEGRLRDTNVLGDSEELRDKYLIFSYDLRYGNAITAHKSQASTYSHVFIDEMDFDKIQDHWSYRHNAQIRASKERNQLKYVAFSRATDNVYVLING